MFEAGDEDNEDDEVLLTILEDKKEDDEDAIHLQISPGRQVLALPRADGHGPGLRQYCRAAARLSIDWPSQPVGKGAERDLYDGKWLSSCLPSARQLIPAVPACVAR